MKKITVILIVFTVIPFLHGCYYDNLEELHPATGLDVPCDTSGTVSFSNDILPILNGNCGTTNSCHINVQSSSGYGLANWGDVTNTMNNTPHPTDFINSITHDPSLDPIHYMPLNGGKLNLCSIMKIQAWVNRGAPNN